MGHRANFVIIQDGLAKAYWDQWAALGCLDGFAAGPDLVLEMLADFEPTTELLEWAFAEGGCLIDFDARIAIVFGSPMDDEVFVFDESDDESADEEVAEFDPKSYLEGLSAAWSGWKLIFDDRGVDAFALYLQSKRIEGIECKPASHPPDTKPPCELQA